MVGAPTTTYVNETLEAHKHSPLKTQMTQDHSLVSAQTLLQEGCFGGRNQIENSLLCRRSNVPNVLVLGDIRRLLSRTAAVGGEAGGCPREAGAWNLRAPNVIASHIDVPHEV